METLGEIAFFYSSYWSNSMYSMCFLTESQVYWGMIYNKLWNMHCAFR